MKIETYRVQVCRWCAARELGVCKASHTDVLCCSEGAEAQQLAQKVKCLSQNILSLRRAYAALNARVEDLEPSFDDVKIGGTT